MAGLGAYDARAPTQRTFRGGPPCLASSRFVDEANVHQKAKLDKLLPLPITVMLLTKPRLQNIVPGLI